MRQPPAATVQFPAAASMAGALPRAGGGRVLSVAGKGDRIGFVFILSLLWLLFDLGRPYTPPGLPLLITAVLFLDWLFKRDKQLGQRWGWWLVLLGVIGSGVLIAENNFSSYVSTRLMGTLFLGICLPMQGLLTSVRRVRWWVYTFIGVAFYVGAWAATHGGFGPAASNGQDENYVATLMAMGMAMAYFSLFTDKRLWFRILLCASMVIYLAAMALAGNPSRGGFIALLVVALYGIWRSPRKIMGLTIVAGAGLVLAGLAGQVFWKEIETTTDYSDGTGDMRLELWKCGIRMFTHNPLLGVGAGNFRWQVDNYQSEEQFEKFGRSLGGTVAHSMHVEMLAEVGGLGALAMIVLTWTTWTGLGKILPEKRGPGAPPLSQEMQQLVSFADALRAAILAVLVSGAFLSLFYYSHLWVLLAVGRALPYVHRRVLQREAQAQGLAAVAAAPMTANVAAPASGLLPQRMRGLPGHGRRR